MASSNLGIQQVTASQQNKTARINTQTNELELALTNRRAHAMPDSNDTLTNAEFVQEYLTDFTGALTAGRTLNVPTAREKPFLMRNSTTGGFAITVQVTGGGGANVVLTDANWHLLHCDGTDVIDLMPVSAGAVFQGALAHLDGNDVITTGAGYTMVEWNDEVEGYDDSQGVAWHDTVTNPERMTVPAGVTRLQLFASIQWEAGGTGTRGARFVKNAAGSFMLGDASISPETVPDGTQTDIVHLTSAVIPVVEGDWFAVEVRHDQGADLDVLDSNTSWFCALAVG